jgi:hypothetical protein
MLKLVVLTIFACACAWAQPRTYSVTLNPAYPQFDQGYLSPNRGPLNVGGQLVGTCYTHIPGNQHMPPQTISTPIDTGSHVEDIGVLVPSGGRGPCNSDVTFTAWGHQVVRLIGVNASVVGLAAGVFSMSWTYTNPQLQQTYYQITNFKYTYCDNYQEEQTNLFTYPC